MQILIIDISFKTKTFLTFSIIGLDAVWNVLQVFGNFKEQKLVKNVINSI